MAKFNGGPIFYEVNPDGPNVQVEEVSSTSFIAMREVRWNPDGPFKLDIRRYFIKQDGEEMPGKGISISDPNNLTETLVQNGYGRVPKLLQNIQAYRGGICDGVGIMCADMTDDEYTKFQMDMTTAREKEIMSRGMSHDKFMEALDE